MKEWGGGRRGGYSRLLSPFHLQVPLCFPEPSPGALRPPCASASSAATSSRDIHLDAMLPTSNACNGAPARSQGSEGPGAAGWVITHAAALRNPKEQNILLLLLGFPRSVSPGPRLPEPRGGGSHVPQPTARLLLEGDRNYPEVSFSAARNSISERRGGHSRSSGPSPWNIDPALFFLPPALLLLLLLLSGLVVLLKISYGEQHLPPGDAELPPLLLGHSVDRRHRR